MSADDFSVGDYVIDCTGNYYNHRGQITLMIDKGYYRVWFFGEQKARNRHFSNIEHDFSMLDMIDQI